MYTSRNVTLVFKCILRSRSTGFISFHFWYALLIWWVMNDGVVVGIFDSVCPRYLNCLTFLIVSLFSFIIDSLFSISSGALKIIVLVLSVAIVRPKRLNVLL